MFKGLNVAVGKKAAIIEDFEGLAGKINIEVTVEGNEGLEKVRDKLFAKIAKDPQRYAETIAHFQDFIKWCTIYSDRQTAVIELRHFTDINDKKISEATGFTIEEMDELDNKFWPEIKKDMLKKRNMTEEEYEELVNAKTAPLDAPSDDMEDIFRQWYRMPEH